MWWNYKRIKAGELIDFYGIIMKQREEWNYKFKKDHELNNFYTKYGLKFYENKFSEKFINIIGRNNYYNTTGCEFSEDILKFYEYLLEYDSIYEYINKLNNIFLGIHEIRYIGPNQYTHAEIKDDTFYWRRADASGTSWIDFIQTIIKEDHLTTLATLGFIINVTYEYLFTFSSNKNQDIELDYYTYTERIPEQFEYKNIHFKKIDINYIENYRKDKICAFVEYMSYGYMSENQNYIIPASNVNNIMCFGRKKPNAFFLNQEMIDKNISQHVIFCSDMRLAFRLKSLIDLYQQELSDKIIITSYIGEDPSLLNWRMFYNKKVVYIPAPNIKSLKLIKWYKNIIIDYKAISFSIANKFILPFDKHSSERIEQLSSIEKYIYLNSISVNEEIFRKPLFVLEKIISESIGCDDYIEILKEHELYKSGSNVLKEIRDINNKDKKLIIPDNFKSKQASIYNEINTSHILKPGSNVLIQGIKNSAKTLISLSACSSLINNNELFGIFPSVNDNESINVAYIDGETPLDELETFKDNFNLRSRHFHMLSIYDTNLPEFCNDFSLTNQNFRDGLKSYLIKNQCLFVFLDNLTALMGKDLCNTSYSNDVAKWIEELQKCNICPIVIIHQQEDKKVNPDFSRSIGSQIFSRKARVEISIISKRELKLLYQKASKNLNFDDDLLRIGLHFKTCKNVHLLDSKTFIIEFVDYKWKLLESPFIENQISNDVKKSTNIDCLSSTIDADLYDFNYINDKIRNHEILIFNYLQDHDEIATRHAKILFNCKDTKAKEILKSLELKGLIMSNGKKGRNAAYKLRN